MKSTAFAVAALASVLIQPALAGPIDGILARPALTIEAGKDSGTELALKRNGEVTSARILPARILRLSADAVAGDTTVIVPKGELLSLYRAAKGDMYCATRAAKFSSMLGKFACLVDTDGDAKFDYSIRVGMPADAGPYRSSIIIGGQKPVAITPVGGEALDPSAHPLFATIKLVLTGGGRNNASFVVLLAQGASKPITIYGTQARAKGDFPVDVEVFGARLTIVGYDDGVTRLRIAQPVPAQPFLLSGGLF